MKVVSDENTNKKLEDAGVSVPKNVDNINDARDVVEKINSTDKAVASIKEDKVEVKQFLID